MDQFISEQVASIKHSFTALTNTNTSATSLLPNSLKTHSPLPPLPPYNLDCCLTCPTVLILTFVTVTLLRSGLWNHDSPRGSDLPPDLAQTLILANQHTSQQCPEAMRALQKPATHKCSCKQSVICLCLWIKCLRGGLSACLGTVCLHQKLVFVDRRLVRVASN